MPQLSQLPPEITFARILLIGHPKAGKSHWAMQAAEAGFQVLYLDGDAATRPTLQKASAEAKQRIWYMDCTDRPEQPRFIRIVNQLCTSRAMIWNDTTQRIHLPGMDWDDDATYWKISLGKMTPNWVLVLDSWTALAWSAQRDFCIRHDLDISQVENIDLSYYRSVGNRLTAFLTLFSHMQGHLVVLAHPDEYVKYKIQRGTQTGRMRDMQKEVEFTRLIPASSSRPHAMTLAKNFTDVLWIEPSMDGTNRYIDGRVLPDREGGSRLAGRKLSTEYSFAQLVGNMPKEASDVDTPISVFIGRDRESVLGAGSSVPEPVLNATGEIRPARTPAPRGLPSFLKQAKEAR